MIFAGLDAGSRSIKAVLFDANRAQAIAAGQAEQGVEQDRLALELFESTLRGAGLARAQVAGIVATGYGRHHIRIADAAVTEITCHARGVRQLRPETRSIIEIGGQDSKVISLDDQGQVCDFAMNDRCAAGSGRFLEVLASRWRLSWDEMAALAGQSRNPATISNMCVVFAETETIGLLAEGKPLADVIAGVQNAVATRVAAQAGKWIRPPVAFTGGVALQPGMARALEAALNCAIEVPPNPQYTGALGAAILAAQRGAAKP